MTPSFLDPDLDARTVCSFQQGPLDGEVCLYPGIGNIQLVNDWRITFHQEHLFFGWSSCIEALATPRAFTGTAHEYVETALEPSSDGRRILHFLYQGDE